MTAKKNNGKRNVTISLDRGTYQKAKILAARRSISISALLAGKIGVLVVEEESYEHAMSQALKMLDRGFHLGGVISTSRYELHER